MLSIIIPSYNRAKLLGGTLDSILNQTYSDLECIVVDDGSTDGTLEMMQSFCNRDPRIRHFQRPKNRLKGAPTCRNIGLEKAKGEYVLFFDSDDFLRPEALYNRMQCVQENMGLDFWVFQTVRFYGDLETADRIWNDLSKPNEQDLTDFLGINPVWHTSGPIWKQSFLEKHKLIFTEGVQSWQDWEFHIRVLLQNPKYLKNQDLTAAAYQRFHQEEAINKNETKAVSEDRISLFYILIEAFITAAKFDKKTQILFLKLFYFVLSRQKENIEIGAVWKKMEAHFTKIPKADLYFWKYYLLFLRANSIKKSNVFLFLVKLKPYFEKRIAVTNFTHRTWYRIQIK